MSSALAWRPPAANRPAACHIVADLADRPNRDCPARSRNGTPASIISRTSEAVPTFSMVLDSHMFESPTMTCRRRYFSASAWGSSRVLMIGRDRVVALETPSQMCSAL